MKIFKKLFYKYLFLLKFHQKKQNYQSDIENYADLIVLNPNLQLINKTIPKIIWLYWEGVTPPLVEKCIAQIQKLHLDYEVNILGPDNIGEYCSFDLNNDVVKKATAQQRADLIRFNLIYQYGGIWLDASIITYEKLDWINDLVQQQRVEGFSYYRAKNTIQIEFPVLENWLLASTAKNKFFQHWFNELYFAIEIGPKNYIQQIRKMENSRDIFQEIGRLEYLVAYVACQRIMRLYPVSMVLINCDKNALIYQVTNQWIKEKVLIDLAINFAPNEKPKVIKLAGKERVILNDYLIRKKYLKNTLIDF
ncbi:glycosyltransferase family 32 protein [Acinetobacter sp. Ver3]|uniref:glycosyltransferase family 32 protein n=1 Tax=Acinetobacter sp. Ver3 TaxID=466088 RepID=UPI0004480799|nr:capsular polysaccharide synthesis protein [Acinetobacter sp. Ver3]EZQ11585.1 WfdM [Acinetobacter sp. Ver3]